MTKAMDTTIKSKTTQLLLILCLALKKRIWGNLTSYLSICIPTLMYLFKHLPWGLAATSWRQKTSILCPSLAWMFLSWPGCNRHKALITLPDVKRHLLSPNTVTLTSLLHQPPLLPGRDVAHPPRLHWSLGALPAETASHTDCDRPLQCFLCQSPKLFISSNFLKIPLVPDLPIHAIGLQREIQETM